MQLMVSDKKHIVVGIGKTGVSCVRYLLGQGADVEVVDTRENPSGLDKFRSEFPHVPLRLGPLDSDYLCTADDLVVSPGVAIATPEISRAMDVGVHVTGDIDIFSCVAEAPIIAITGSNGKSTVTTLLGEMAKNAGTKVATGGNLGTPALDLLDPSIELYILELSSFQLETTRRLGAMSATVLNVSEDHMDRYPTIEAYHAAKHRVFNGSNNAIVNDDQPLTNPLLTQGMRVIHFGLGHPALKKFSTISEQEEVWLAYGYQTLLPVREMKLRGKHNISNALAALALGHTAGLPMDRMVETLKTFSGLPHRCEWVRTINSVDYINDSKGTNVGATCAAIDSLGGTISGKVILIAGGEGKDSDFSPLKSKINRYVSEVCVIGRDAKLIARVAEGVPVTFCDTLQDAVIRANAVARPGDLVLLSPACASFDMFDNYEQRGCRFAEAVNRL
ncbi:MAG: UDP-N-acetylmuramoyl-L-alanine--D-glutamate ligase [Proteobacteria bacterium]|nr:MAG: UDP-N-acetylmuramoyl-L-alanine--D-glutamate ligase [Pseudomonadota bacterium]